MLEKHASSVAAHPQGHPWHGMVYGSPEHDICGAPGYFFSVNVWHIRGLDSLGKLHAEFPSLSTNATLEAQLLPTATEWRGNVRFAANFTAVRKADGSGELYFLSPVVGSLYGRTESASTPLLPGGSEADCYNRSTCFASMSAGLPGGGSNQHTNYANFRIFSESLLAGVLDREFELAIMTFREARRGTLSGMTRFRDLLDDMPILGYGKASLRHDRLYSFHNTLAGHSMNYISRGTYSGSEQRQQLDYSVGGGTGIAGQKYRNYNCGIGGEDCSLCVVSAIPSSYWVRWMLVADSADEDMIFIARGAPRRWYAGPAAEPFGISNAPTRFGTITFAMQAAAAQKRVSGTVTLAVYQRSTLPAAAGVTPALSIKIRAPQQQRAAVQACTVTTNSSSAVFVAWHPQNETAVFRLAGGSAAFTFSATFH